MNTIIGDLGKCDKFKDLLHEIEEKTSPILISGLTDVGMIQIQSAIKEYTKRPICIITYNEIQAKKIYENLKVFTDSVVIFPKKEIVTYDYVAESKDLPYKRIEALNEIKSKKTNEFIVYQRNCRTFAKRKELLAKQTYEYWRS